MTVHASHLGSREVEPVRRRRRKRPPSDDRRTERRLAERIDSTARERQDAWAATGQPETTACLSAELDAMFDAKRVLR
jgi:hypothetical protein